MLCLHSAQSCCRRVWTVLGIAMRAGVRVPSFQSSRLLQAAHNIISHFTPLDNNFFFSPIFFSEVSRKCLLMETWNSTLLFELLAQCQKMHCKNKSNSRGFNFILFWTFNRNQTENDRYCQKNNFFTFCKMFENVLFFSHLRLKFAKSAFNT